MKNYINIRLQFMKENAINHNFRTEKQKMSKSQCRDIPNDYLDLEDMKIKTITKDNVTKLRNHYNGLRYAANQEFKQLRDERNGRTINDKKPQGWIEGVLTFSEAIHQDLGTKYSKVDLFNCAIKTIRQIEKEWGPGIKLTGLVLHNDEKTPHFQFHMTNYQTKEQNSEDFGVSMLNKKRTTEDLSRLQDIAYENFKVLGMERGIKKQFSLDRPYQTTRRYYAKQFNFFEKKLNQQKSINAKELEVNKQKTALEYKEFEEQYKNLTETKKREFEAVFEAYEDNLKVFDKYRNEFESILKGEAIDIQKLEAFKKDIENAKKQYKGNNGNDDKVITIYNFYQRTLNDVIKGKDLTSAIKKFNSYATELKNFEDECTSVVEANKLVGFVNVNVAKEIIDKYKTFTKKTVTPIHNENLKLKNENKELKELTQNIDVDLIQKNKDLELKISELSSINSNQDKSITTLKESIKTLETEVEKHKKTIEEQQQKLKDSEEKAPKTLEEINLLLKGEISGYGVKNKVENLLNENKSFIKENNTLTRQVNELKEVELDLEQKIVTQRNDYEKFIQDIKNTWKESDIESYYVKFPEEQAQSLKDEEKEEEENTHNYGPRR
ncbi:MAG: hypothetical protein EOM78_13010 [Erysipelotrichia bacterium]|nr:hypothetical protein [Erysipelotrichia bacterium]